MLEIINDFCYYHIVNIEIKGKIQFLKSIIFINF